MSAEKKTYFWLCSYPLGPGSIVEPGNWGRILKCSGGGSLCEYIFESVRIKNYPALPSRLESNFLCETKEDIVKFRNENNRLYDLIYEVELVDDKAPVFDTDWSTFLHAPTSNWQEIEKAAHNYWQPPKSMRNIEVLVLSAIRILRRIDG